MVNWTANHFKLSQQHVWRRKMMLSVSGTHCVWKETLSRKWDPEYTTSKAHNVAYLRSENQIIWPECWAIDVKYHSSVNVGESVVAGASAMVPYLHVCDRVQSQLSFAASHVPNNLLQPILCFTKVRLTVHNCSFYPPMGWWARLSLSTRLVFENVEISLDVQTRRPKKIRGGRWKFICGT